LDPGSEIRDLRSGIRDPGSEIRDPRSGIRDPGSEIRDLKSGIRDPGWGKIQKKTEKSRSGIGDKHLGSTTLVSPIDLKRTVA